MSSAKVPKATTSNLQNSSKNRSISLLDKTTKKFQGEAISQKANHPVGDSSQSASQQTMKFTLTRSIITQGSGDKPKQQQKPLVPSAEQLSPSSGLLPRKVSFSIDRQQATNAESNKPSHACHHKEGCSKRSSQNSKQVCIQNNESNNGQKIKAIIQQQQANLIDSTQIAAQLVTDQRTSNSNDKENKNVPTSSVVSPKFVVSRSSSYHSNEQQQFSPSGQSSVPGSASKRMLSSDQNIKQLTTIDSNLSGVSGSNRKRFDDMQMMMSRMKMEASQKLDRVEMRQMQESVDQAKIIESQYLEIRSQQKKILLLTQEKDLLKEQSDANENKVKQLLSKLKHMDKVRMDLQEQVQEQVELVSEAKSQAHAKAVSNQEFHVKNEILRKQLSEIEKEKTLVIENKTKSDAEVKSKLEQFDALNRQNQDITVDYQRKHKDSQYQIKTLMDRLAEFTAKYTDEKKNHEIYEKKYRAERNTKEALQIQLKLIEAQVHENAELRRKLATAESKLDEAESVVDQLKRKIRKNLDIDMKEESKLMASKYQSTVERIVEKPIFVEKLVDPQKSKDDAALLASYKQQMERCIEDLNELRRVRGVEQEQFHSKLLECETWKSHSNNIEDKYCSEITALKVTCEISQSQTQTQSNEKDAEIAQLKSKIRALLAEIESLTSQNIDKNRQIAVTLLNPSSQSAAAAAANSSPLNMSNKKSYIPYTQFYDA